MKLKLAIVTISTVIGLLTIKITGNNKSYDDLLERPVHVDDRQWHRWLMRGGKIEPEKMVAARKIVKEKVRKIRSANNLKDGGLDNWISLGPRNVGGRIRAIALQPTKTGGENIFVGAAGGGIFELEEGSITWSANNDFAPSMAVTSIVVDPIDPSVIYASTGEGQAHRTIGIPGAGIYKSIDGGNSWNQLASTNNDNFYWVNKIAIDPGNNNRLLAVTTNLDKDGDFLSTPFGMHGALYESLDAGATWTKILEDTGVLTDVEFHPTISSRVVVSGGGTLKVYNSSTQSWDEKVTSMPGEIPLYTGQGRIEVAISPLNAAYVIYALVNRFDEPEGVAMIFRSVDGGATWEYRSSTSEVFSSNTLGNYANTIVVDPANNLNGLYLGGVDLWKSTDGGITLEKISDWTQYHEDINDDISINTQLHADQHIVIPSLNYSATNKKMYIGNDGGIQATDDISTANDGNSSGWENLINNSLNITQIYGGAVSSVPNDFAVGTQDNGILIRQIDGKWKEPSTGDVSQVIFKPGDPSTIFYNVNYNKLKKSTDGGITFSTVDTLGEEEALLVSPMALNKQNTDLIYLGGKSLWVYDDGEPDYNSVELKAPLPPLGTFDQYITTIAVDDQFRSIWIGYSSGRIEYSEDGGSSWSGDISPFSMPNRAITDIDIRSFGSNGLRALITVGGYHQNSIWSHEAPGNVSNWENISLDFDMQCNTITHHPTNSEWIYVGTDVGIFASEDYGANWSVYPSKGAGSNNPLLRTEGPTYTEVSDLFWEYSSSEDVSRLCAATFGRGLWRSFSVLPNAFVNRNNISAPFEGSRIHPFRLFTEAMQKAEGTGTNVTFLTAGTHNEVTNNTLIYDQRVLINSELTQGFSVIVE